MSHEILSSGKERVRHGFDWTVRRHPSVAAGIAGAVVTLAGAYVAVHADHGSENVAATRPPAAVGAAPAVPRDDVGQPPPRLPPVRSAADQNRPSGPRSGPGAPPGIPHPPESQPPPNARPAGLQPVRPAEPAQPRRPAEPTHPTQPVRPPAADCVLRVDLLGNVVKVCL